MPLQQNMNEQAYHFVYEDGQGSTMHETTSVTDIDVDSPIELQTLVSLADYLKQQVHASSEKDEQRRLQESINSPVPDKNDLHEEGQNVKKKRGSRGAYRKYTDEQTVVFFHGRSNLDSAQLRRQDGLAIKGAALTTSRRNAKKVKTRPFLARLPRKKEDQNTSLRKSTTTSWSVSLT